MSDLQVACLADSAAVQHFIAECTQCRSISLGAFDAFEHVWNAHVEGVEGVGNVGDELMYWLVSGLASNGVESFVWCSPQRR